MDQKSISAMIDGAKGKQSEARFANPGNAWQSGAIHLHVE
jgi:hypothetical protein